MMKRFKKNRYDPNSVVTPVVTLPMDEVDRMPVAQRRFIKKDPGYWEPGPFTC